MAAVNVRVTYEPKYDYFICKVNGHLMECVACGKPLQYREPHGKNFHKCDDKHMAARQSAMTRSDEPHMRTPPYSERLSDGFKLMGEE